MRFQKLLLIAITSIVVISLVGCQNSSDSKSFADYNIGDRFVSNRDGYMIKLNSSFFASISYKETEDAEIFKLLDLDSADIIGNSKLYFTGNFRKCYSNDDSIIIKSDINNNYVFIDCNNVNNQRISSTVAGLNIDLSTYTEILI